MIRIYPWCSLQIEECRLSRGWSCGDSCQAWRELESFDKSFGSLRMLEEGFTIYGVDLELNLEKFNDLTNW